MPRVVPAMLLTLLLAAGAVGCGGGGDDADGDRADEVTGDTEDGGTETTAPAGDDPDASPDAGSASEELGVDREFTGEGSEELCREVTRLQSDGSLDLSDRELADRLSGITPPPEIASEWETVHRVIARAADPAGGEDALPEDEMAAWADANAVVAAYLVDVCEIGD
jgi:hypothetical protein